MRLPRPDASTAGGFSGWVVVAFVLAVVWAVSGAPWWLVVVPLGIVAAAVVARVRAVGKIDREDV